MMSVYTAVTLFFARARGNAMEKPTALAVTRSVAYVAARAKTLIVLAVIAATLTKPVHAQITGSVSQQRDLSFGTVLTGSSKTIAPTAAGAAMWKVHGILTLSGGFSFTLPSILTLQSGSTTMPITYSSTSAIYNVGSSNPATGTVFNPANGKGLVVALLSDIYIWLGATVNPPLNQKAGTYQGTVVLTVAGLL